MTRHPRIFFMCSVGFLLALTAVMTATAVIDHRHAASSQLDFADGIHPAGNQVNQITGDLDSVDWNGLVGQRVSIKGELVVVDTFDLIRRGQVRVARKRLFVPTNRIDPNDADPESVSYEGGSNVAQVNRAQKYNDAATVIIDDGSADENIFPPTLFPKLGKSLPTVRTGSVIKGVTGRVVRAGRRILLIPNRPLRWTPAPRPERPSVGESAITVASFNVLNYFTTIDNGQNNARGADTAAELKRQQAKIVAAIQQLDADVIGLMELENNLAAEKRLIQALNRSMKKDVYAGCGLPEGFRTAPGGSDAIRVGIIYRQDRVRPVGKTGFVRDDSFWLARTPLVQGFTAIDQENPFAVIVNHFKSKGGSNRAEPVNKNKGDGQGAYNAARRDQALAICQYIDQLKPSGDESPPVLVIGDLNAYGQEDPIDAMRAKGLVDLHAKAASLSAKKTQESYSFIYFGQSGALDHAMATPSLAARVTGIAAWHINADEPRFLDYNQERNPKSLYQPDAYRSSDHDPVIIGIAP